MTRAALLTATIIVAGILCQSETTLAQVRDPVAAYTDSVLRLIRQTPGDSERFHHYLELSLFWSDRDTSKATLFLKKAQSIIGGKATGFQKGLLHLYTGNIIFSHDIQSARFQYMTADRHLSQLNTPIAYRYRAKAWNNYGILFQIKDSADAYMDIIVRQVIPYARLGGDSIAVGNALLNIGTLLANIQDATRAKSYFTQAIHTLSATAGADEQKLTAYVNAAKSAVIEREFADARAYLDSGRVILGRIPHSGYAAHYYRTEGNYHRHQQQKEVALQMFRQALALAERLNDEQIMRDIYFEIYATYRDAQEYASAKKYLMIADEYDAIAGAPDRLLHMREMAATEYRMGNLAKAYELMERYALQKDTVYERNTALKVIALERKYETVEKENQILKLQEVNVLQQRTINNNRLWLAVLVAAFVLTLVTAYFTWKLAKINRKTLRHKELLHSQELKSLKQQEELNQYQAVLHVQEEERNRIARDLHDGLGGLLAGVKLRLSALAAKEQQRDVTRKPAIDAVIVNLDKSSDELRRIARNMMPEALLYMGLQPALADLCNYLDTPATAVKFQAIAVQESYPQDVLIGVYRIVQELLNNAVRHARASEIIVQCSDGDGHLFLTVEDNGEGFDLHDTKKGLGLRNIENRVALFGGRIEIESQRGHGTSVHIEIPLDNGKNN